MLVPTLQVRVNLETKCLNFCFFFQGSLTNFREHSNILFFSPHYASKNLYKTNLQPFKDVSENLSLRLGHQIGKRGRYYINNILQYHARNTNDVLTARFKKNFNHSYYFSPAHLIPVKKSQNITVIGQARSWISLFHRRKVNKIPSAIFTKKLLKPSGRRCRDHRL